METRDSLWPTSTRAATLFPCQKYAGEVTACRATSLKIFSLLLRILSSSFRHGVFLWRNYWNNQRAAHLLMKLLALLSIVFISLPSNLIYIYILSYVFGTNDTAHKNSNLQILYFGLVNKVINFILLMYNIFFSIYSWICFLKWQCLTHLETLPFLF